jgi:autotransporter-associated beta strand protein
MGGTAPTVGVDSTGDVSLEFNAPGAYTATNDIPGTYGVFNATFDAGNGPTTLSGNDIYLSDPTAEPLNPFFTNNSTNPVTVNNNVAFGLNNIGTTEQFVLAPGSTTTFNGTMTLNGGSALTMRNGEPNSNLGGPGGTMIWTQPVTFTNVPNSPFLPYFSFRIYEGTFEMGGYTIDNGISDAPLINIDGVNIFPSSGVNNANPQTDVYLGPEDRYTTYPGTTLLHPNDVASFYLIGAGDAMNNRVEFGDAGTMTVGGLNTSGTVTFNSFFNTLPTDGNGTVGGVSQTIYYSAAAGGTVVQNFQLIPGGPGGPSGACTAGIDKIGPGTWIVNCGGDNPSGAQAYYGNTTVRDGTLELEYDDTGTNFVTLPAAVLSNPNAGYYASGDNGGSLGYNAPTSTNVLLDAHAVQLGDSGTLPMDNIALLTLVSPNVGPSVPRQVLHNISVNNDNPLGTTTIGVGDNGIGDFTGNILLFRSVVLTGGSGGVANFSGNVAGTGAVIVNGTGTVNLSGANTYSVGTTLTAGTLVASNTTGSATGSGNVTLNGGILASGTTGSISGNVSAGATSVIAPGGVGSIGTLALGGLSTVSGATLNFDLGTGSGTITNGSLLTLGSGTVSIANGTNITLATDPGVSAVGNDYELIGGTIGAISTSSFNLPTAPGGVTYSLSKIGGFIDLVVAAGEPVTLSWDNAGGTAPDNGQTWDTTNNNWNSGSAATTYTDGAAVTFNDTNNGHYAVTLNSTVHPGSVTVNNSLGSYSITTTGGGKIADTGAFTKSGAGTLTLGTALSVGSMSITGGTVKLATGVSGGSGPGVTSPIDLTSLSISGSGVLDINNDHLIITYGASDPITTIAGYIKAGYNGGGWNGTGGIISSVALTNASGLLYGVGYADGKDGVVSGLVSGQIEVAYTLLGDANLDGLVNGSDFNILAANFNQSITGWDQGDFNYDGLVNASDFNVLAANFNQGVSGAASAGDVAALDAFAAANGLSLPTSSVPEPASLGLLAMGAIGMLARRRRSSR